MALTRSDALILLSEIEEKGVDTSECVNLLASSHDLPIEVVRFINSHRQLDVTRFYQKVRKSYNSKHSNLYINIVKEIEDPNEVLTTLASLELQILLFCKQVKDVEMFMKNARLLEISYVLANYAKTYDLTKCIKLLRIIKADLKALEAL